MNLGARHASRILRRATAYLKGERVVLVYHRVADLAQDPWGLAVSPARFEAQIRILAERGAAVPLRALLDGARTGERIEGRPVKRIRERTGAHLPRRAVAVTFDDGYADNLLHAAPVLERYGVPATVFLSPGLLDGRTPFWWDVLTGLILEAPALPETLTLEIGGRPFGWTTAGLTCAPEADGSETAWRVGHPPRRPAHHLYVALWILLRHLENAERNAALAGIAAWAGYRPASAARDRPLSRDEAVRLAGHRGIEIGAHTLSHPSLPACDDAMKRAEIWGSRAACEAISGRPVTCFSYPFGDADEATVALVREAGFSSACTTRPEPVRRLVDPLRVPRVPAADWSGPEFARRLQRSGFCC